MNTDMTVKAIEEMALILDDYKRIAEEAAKELNDTGDWGVCSDLLGRLAGLHSNLRLDLLIIRPIRELEREIREINKP